MVRIGMVNYINTAPIYEVWKEEVHRADWQVTEAPPSTLNRLLAADELDLGFVSSYEYAVRPEKYQILADLSISATGPVGSVYLFSSVEPEQLDNKLILMTGQSDTSVCLVRIILEEFLSIQPRYVRGEIFGPADPEERPAAVLAIGDEALRLKFDNNYPVQLDLAEVWNKKTGLPFVFAVCAVREEFIAKNATVVREIREIFL
jgi:chorismate dehydratase